MNGPEFWREVVAAGGSRLGAEVVILVPSSWVSLGRRPDRVSAVSGMGGRTTAA